MSARTKKPLSDAQFLEVVAATPLVSIDLVVRNESNQILMGLRVNEPAKGTWFVPGGRIRKGETLEAAFGRICRTEIGKSFDLSETRFVGSFTHKYDTNAFEAPGVKTHYVVLAYELRVPATFVPVLDPLQHSEFGWFSRQDVDPESREDSELKAHDNVKPYFQDAPGMTDTQYSVLNARRDLHNSMVWQTPVLSLTAQAFLFTIILSPDFAVNARIVAGALAMAASLGSMQLLAKHRFMDVEYGKALHSCENARGVYAANRKVTAERGVHRLSSYWVWQTLLLVFLLAAALSVLVVTTGWFPL